MTKPIIFYEGIVTPPSEDLALRSVCLYVSVFLKKDTEFLLETEKQNKDAYYKWVKRTGLYDFISELIEPRENVYGLRISEIKKRQPCVTINRVSWDNLDHVINILSN